MPRMQRMLLLGIIFTLGVMDLVLVHREAASTVAKNHWNTVKSKWDDVVNSGSESGDINTSNGRENATFLTLARNDELEKLLPSIINYEAMFNSKYNYDWVFLNNEEFSETFINQVTLAVSGRARFAKVEPEFWGYPESVDLEKAAASRQKLVDENVIYGGSESYRHMCRFQSGFFFQTEIMKEYKYYWRVEPETSLLCEVDYDVFKFFRENKFKYGWTLSLYEWIKTIPTLWETTMEFVKENPKAIHKNNMASFISNDNLESYNLCHFWSNFEIGDLDFWRGPIYSKYFEFLDSTNKFFYERWGDAPVHSIAAALFMDKKDIHFFDDIGYSHPPFSHCPSNQEARGLKCRCVNNGKTYNNDVFDWHQSSCRRTYHQSRGEAYEDANPNLH